MAGAGLPASEVAVGRQSPPYQDDLLKPPPAFRTLRASAVFQASSPASSADRTTVPASRGVEGLLVGIPAARPRSHSANRSPAGQRPDSWRPVSRSASLITWVSAEALGPHSSFCRGRSTAMMVCARPGSRPAMHVRPRAAHRSPLRSSAGHASGVRRRHAGHPPPRVSLLGGRAGWPRVEPGGTARAATSASFLRQRSRCPAPATARCRLPSSIFLGRLWVLKQYQRLAAAGPSGSGPQETRAPSSDDEVAGRNHPVTSGLLRRHGPPPRGRLSTGSPSPIPPS